MLGLLLDDKFKGVSGVCSFDMFIFKLGMILEDCRFFLFEMGCEGVMMYDG